MTLIVGQGGINHGGFPLDRNYGMEEGHQVVVLVMMAASGAGVLQYEKYVERQQLEVAVVLENEMVETPVAMVYLFRGSGTYLERR